MTQTFRDPRSTLARHGLKPNRALSQNFLRDAGVAAAILELLPAEPPRILEVGAGPGTMTRGLASGRTEVVAVEIDRYLVPVLLRETADLPVVRVLEGDALTLDLGAAVEAPFAVFGNIPYHVTGALIPRLLALVPAPDWVCLMVQLEVAERICAEPGGWSLATLGVRAFATAELLLRVPAHAFEPAPKVDSAVMMLRPQPRAAFADAEFFAFARAVFMERRKKLANGVANALGHDVTMGRAVVAGAGLDEMRRPQTLDLAEWERLYAAFLGRAS